MARLNHNDNNNDSYLKGGVKFKGSDYQLTGSISGTPLATQSTDRLPSTSLSIQQVTHLQGLSPYSQEYNNYPTLSVSYVLEKV